uniref:Secreted protein n=1 Tax=Knipowitschia caucasica TaxID=637954 RepID=A0AAV2IVN0_KNICA
MKQREKAGSNRVKERRARSWGVLSLALVPRTVSSSALSYYFVHARCCWSRLLPQRVFYQVQVPLTERTDRCEWRRERGRGGGEEEEEEEVPGSRPLPL